MSSSESDWQIWELEGGLLKNEPRHSVDSIFNSDQVIDERTKKKCPDEIGLLLDLFEFLTGLIRGYYLAKDGWRENIALRVALALVNQCWNYHSAVLKLISSGYFGESHSLRRSWFERVTLAYLLFGTQDRELADVYEHGDLRRGEGRVSCGSPAKGRIRVQVMRVRTVVMPWHWGAST